MGNFYHLKQLAGNEVIPFVKVVLAYLDRWILFEIGSKSMTRFHVILSDICFELIRKASTMAFKPFIYRLYNILYQSWRINFW